MNCAQASFTHYAENMFVWSDIREICMDLLSANAFDNFQEFCNLYVFDTNGDENCRIEWEELIRQCDDYKRQIGIQNNFEERSIDERARCIAFDQLKAWSLYVEDKPVEKAAYRNFLVRIFFFVRAMRYRCRIVSHYLFYRYNTAVMRLQIL
jgi:hypothetical protein